MPHRHSVGRRSFLKHVGVTALVGVSGLKTAAATRASESSPVGSDINILGSQVEFEATGPIGYTILAQRDASIPRDSLSPPWPAVRCHAEINAPAAGHITCSVIGKDGTVLAEQSRGVGASDENRVLFMAVVTPEVLDNPSFIGYAGNGFRNLIPDLSQPFFLGTAKKNAPNTPPLGGMIYYPNNWLYLPNTAAYDQFTLRVAVSGGFNRADAHLYTGLIAPFDQAAAWARASNAGSLVMSVPYLNNF